MAKPSEAQIEANRRNAKHSRGPKTESGKHRSSQNAMRHGLTGRVVVLPEEDMEAFKAFSKEIVESLNANSPMERQYAQTIADSQWRLNRARTFEDGMIALGHFDEAGNFTAGHSAIHAALTAAKVFRDHSKDFVNLALYEQRIGKAQKEAFRQLYDLQARRKAASAMQPTLEEPKPVLQAATVAAVSSVLSDGQDLSPQTVDGHALSPQTPDSKRNIVVGGFVCSSLEIVPAALNKPTEITTTAPVSVPEKRAA